MVRAVLEELEAAGWRTAIVPFSCRAEAQQGIASRHERGEFDEGFYEERVAGLVVESNPEVPTPRSLFCVAVPDRPVRIRFTLEGRAREAIVPPTYVHGERSDRAVEERIRKVLAPAGFSVARARGPTKAMAALSELACYGRNNLTYVQGLGSFHRPVVLVSDLPCDEAPRREPEILPRCRTCRACLAACPTGAIGEDRFLLHAERCLTFWNEKPPHVPFPTWIRPEWHNALVGCLLCQKVCPENRPFLDSIVEGPLFDERTTEAFLAGAVKETLPPEVQRALEDWDLSDALDTLPRNLGALLAKPAGKGKEGAGKKKEKRR